MLDAGFSSNIQHPVSSIEYPDALRRMEVHNTIVSNNYDHPLSYILFPGDAGFRKKILAIMFDRWGKSRYNVSNGISMKASLQKILRLQWHVSNW